MDVLAQIDTLRAAAHALLGSAPASSPLATPAAASSSGDFNATACKARQSVETVLEDACDETESVLAILGWGHVPGVTQHARLLAAHLDSMLQLLQRASGLGKNLELQAVQVQHTRELGFQAVQQMRELELQAGQMWELEHQAVQHKQALKNLRKQLAALQADSDDLLFHELAIQTVSKIIRKADPDCSIWDARRTPLRVVKGTAVYRDVMLQHPHIKLAIEASHYLGRPIGHPVPTAAVTEGSLRACIQRALPGLVRPAAEELLDCLVALAAELREPLFIDTPPGPPVNRQQPLVPPVSALRTKGPACKGV